MYVCQWHLDIPYGKQGEALAVMRAWGAEKFASSEFRRARGARLLSGVLGPSASHIVDEYQFETLADFEAALAGMSGPPGRTTRPGWLRWPSAPFARPTPPTTPRTTWSGTWPNTSASPGRRRSCAIRAG